MDNMNNFKAMEMRTLLNFGVDLVDWSRSTLEIDAELRVSTLKRGKGGKVQFHQKSWRVTSNVDEMQLSLSCGKEVQWDQLVNVIFLSIWHSILKKTRGQWPFRSAGKRAMISILYRKKVQDRNIYPASGTSEVLIWPLQPYYGHRIKSDLWFDFYRLNIIYALMSFCPVGIIKSPNFQNFRTVTFTPPPAHVVS